MQLVIGCSLVPVETSESLHEQDQHGEFNSYPHPVISISPSVEGSEAALTVLHEALHCISEQEGLNLKERQVRSLEQALGRLFLFNPHFTHWFLENLHADLAGHPVHPPGPAELPEAHEAPGSAGS